MRKITGEWLQRKSEEVMIELEPLLERGWVDENGTHRTLFYLEVADRINKFMNETDGKEKEN